jgi:ribonuclease HI
MDGSRSDYSRVGAAAVCKHGDRSKAFRSHLRTGPMEVYDAELWAIRLALRESVRKRDRLQTHGVTKVAVFSDSQATMRRTEHLDPGPGEPIARLINRSARTLCEAGIETEIHWVPGHTGIPGNEEADHQANLARENHRIGTVREQVHTSAANRTGRISETQMVAKAEWEADKCSKHHGYRLTGKAGSKRPIPMNSVKPLAARFYQLKSGHAPVGTYLKRFGHRDDDKCLWCGGGRRTAQTLEHLFRHCSRWTDQQKTLCKEVGTATGWSAGRCRHVKVSELLSIEQCDQAVMDFLAATDVGKFPPKTSVGARANGQRPAEESGPAGSL